MASLKLLVLQGHTVHLWKALMFLIWSQMVKDVVGHLCFAKFTRKMQFHFRNLLIDVFEFVDIMGLT